MKKQQYKLTGTIKYLILGITLCFSHLTLLAQQSKIDSLENILKSAKEDTTRLRLYIDLCYTCDTKDNLKYAEPAVKLADKILSQITNEKDKKNVLQKKASAYTCIAIFYREDGNDSSKAFGYYQKTLSIYKSINDQKGIVNTLLPMSYYFGQQGNIPQALEYCQNALSIAQKLNYKNGIADCLIKMANLYSEQGELSQAIINFQKALTIYNELKDTGEVAAMYRNMGFLYIRLHDNVHALECIHKALSIFEGMNDTIALFVAYNDIGIAYMQENDFQNAAENYEKSLSFAEAIKKEYWVAVLLDNLADIYIQQDNVSKAVEYNSRALKINEKINDEIRIARSLGIRARIFLKQKKYNEAMNINDRALKIQKQHGIQNENPELELFSAQIDSAGGNYKAAYAHYQQYSILSKKLKSEEVSRAAIKEKFQSDYDEQKTKDKAEQDKKDAIAFKEFQRQRLVRNGFIGGFAVMLLFSGVFFVQRNRISKEKKISDTEKKRSEELLLNILPYEVAQELKKTGQCQAKTYSMVTVMFADFKDFTSVSEKVSAELLVNEINFCFSAFDIILQKHKVEKIKTVGDAYLCASGLPVLNYTHAVDLVTAAIEIRNFMLIRKKEKEAKGEIPFEIRIGIHTGPVVAGIVGVKKFAYDIWGDTVNIASRIESSGEAGKVNISGNTYELVKDKFTCAHRGKIEAKHKGEIDMYFVETIS